MESRSDPQHRICDCSPFSADIWMEKPFLETIARKKKGWPAITGSDSQFTTAFVIKKDGNKLHQF